MLFSSLDCSIFLHFPKYITHKDLKPKNNDSKVNPRIVVPSYTLRWQGHLRLFRLWMPCLSGCHSHYIHNFLGIQQSRDSKGPGIQNQNLFWSSLMPTVTNTHWGQLCPVPSVPWAFCLSPGFPLWGQIPTSDLTQFLHLGNLVQSFKSSFPRTQAALSVILPGKIQVRRTEEP